MIGDFVLYGLTSSGEVGGVEWWSDMSLSEARSIATDRLRIYQAVEVWIEPICVFRVTRQERPAA